MAYQQPLSSPTPIFQSTKFPSSYKQLLFSLCLQRSSSLLLNSYHPHFYTPLCSKTLLTVVGSHRLLFLSHCFLNFIPIRLCTITETILLKVINDLHITQLSNNLYLEGTDVLLHLLSGHHTSLVFLLSLPFLLSLLMMCLLFTACFILECSDPEFSSLLSQHSFLVLVSFLLLWLRYLTITTQRKKFLF